VRLVLALIGNPWKRPAAALETPSALISAFGSTRSPSREAMPRDSAVVSVRVTHVRPREARNSGQRSARSTDGIDGDGKPVGISPTTGTPSATRSNASTATIAPRTAMRTPGTRGQFRATTRITARAARPTVSAQPLRRLFDRPVKNPSRMTGTVSPPALNPHNLAAWLQTMMIASPLR